MLETIYILSQKGLYKKIKDGEKEDVNEMKKYNPDEEWQWRGKCCLQKTLKKTKKSEKRRP